MILVAGGTGRLGTEVVRLLAARGLRVRVLTRNPERARHLESDRIELVRGDVRDMASVERAMTGTSTVISAIQGFAGSDGSPRTVDGQGNRNLIRAARSGADHFILLSVHGAVPDHPMDLFRVKFQAEQELRQGGLDWTIIRPTAYMETWSAIIGEPLLETGTTRIFGRGTNPINFVSVHDVARFVELAATDPALRGRVVEVGGPENLTLEQLVETFRRETGVEGKVRRVPLPMMRIMALLMQPVKPELARQIQAGVVMDTHDMSFDPAETTGRYPSVALTTLAEMVRRDYPPSTEHGQIRIAT